MMTRTPATRSMDFSSIAISERGREGIGAPWRGERPKGGQEIRNRSLVKSQTYKLPHETGTAAGSSNGNLGITEAGLETGQVGFRNPSKFWWLHLHRHRASFLTRFLGNGMGRQHTMGNVA